MFPVLEKEDLAARVCRYVVSAPEIALKAKAGQFVILRLDEHGERFPITIADTDSSAGTLTLYVQEVGKTTLQMNRMQAGENIRDIAGPLGEPTVIEKFGTVVGVGGGFGVAALHPIMRAMNEAGNRTVSILGARSSDRVILLDEMKRISSEVRVATEDGSLGSKGFVTNLLQTMISDGEPIDRVIAIGPVMMMQAVAEVTRPHSIPTIVSMNPIMMDGTGMCGACRVMVDGQMKFACVDGPEFDGHQVDFDNLLHRLKMYQSEEKKALDQYREELDSECGVKSNLT